MGTINLDLHLYGVLTDFVNSETPGYAHLNVTLPENSKLRDLLAHLKIPTEERGITFINGDLSALPKLQPDLEHILKDCDRIALFDLKSMWPFQYRHGVVMVDELTQKLRADGIQGIHHTYGKQG